MGREEGLEGRYRGEIRRRKEKERVDMEKRRKRREGELGERKLEEGKRDDNGKEKKKR